MSDKGATGTRQPPTASARKSKKPEPPSASKGSGKADPPTKKRKGDKKKAEAAFDFESLAEQIASGSQKLPHWTDAVSKEPSALLGLNGGQPIDAATVRASASAVENELKKDENAEKNGEEVLMAALSQGTTLLQFCAGVDVFKHNPKRALAVLKAVAQYREFNAYRDDLAAAYAQVELPVPTVSPHYDALRQLARNDKLLSTLREFYAARMSRVAKVPDEVIGLIKDYDSLAEAVTKYINADDSEINRLRSALKKLTDARSVRIEETREVKKHISEFNAARSGTLTEEEKTRAVSAYMRNSALQEKLTLDGYLEVCRAKKASGFLERRSSTFRDYRATDRADEFLSGADDVSKRSGEVLHSLFVGLGFTEGDGETAGTPDGDDAMGGPAGEEDIDLDAA